MPYRAWHPTSVPVGKLMPLIAGVDGGASRTRALVVDTETVGAWGGVAGPSNPVNVGVTEAARNIVAALEDAVRKAGRRVGEIEVVAAALAGVDSNLVRRAVEPHLRELTGLNGRLIVDHDAYAALVHATGGRPGVLVVAGTGSIVLAVDPSGRRIILGDRGWLLGDEGSGFWLSRLALRLLRRSFDSLRPFDCLAKGLAEKLGVSNVDELMYWFYLTRGRIDRIASVARYVLELADEGCKPANMLVKKAARFLALLAVKAAKTIGNVEVYFTGSLFNSKTYLNEFLSTIKRSGIRALRRAVFPVVGAIMIAASRAGCRLDHLIADIEKAARTLY